MGRRVRKPQIYKRPAGTAADFDAYAEQVTLRALPVLMRNRSEPYTDAERAIHLAYSDAVIAAKVLPLQELQVNALRQGQSLCRDIDAISGLLADVGHLTAREFIEQYYREQASLTDLWGKAPWLAEGIACWQGLNDVHQFVTCFIYRKNYPDDFRGIYKAVTGSLALYGLLDMWQAGQKICYADYAPPPRLPFLPCNLPRLQPVA